MGLIVTGWNKTALLQKVVTARNSEGVTTEVVESEATVYANPMRMGAESWAAARSVGLHADSSIQIYSAEYADYNRCKVDGVEYEIERVHDSGEYTTLTLKRRLHNA